MRLSVNDHDLELPDGSTVSDVVTHLGLSSSRVAVEVNKQLVRRINHPTTRLNPGDRIEVVTLVGGG